MQINCLCIYFKIAANAPLQHAERNLFLKSFSFAKITEQV